MRALVIEREDLPLRKETWFREVFPGMVRRGKKKFQVFINPFRLRGGRCQNQQRVRQFPHELGQNPCTGTSPQPGKTGGPGCSGKQFFPYSVQVVRVADYSHELISMYDLKIINYISIKKKDTTW
jgi:hypothetical protein